MSDDSQLANSEEFLGDQTELLWRNTHPTWIVNGELTAFRVRKVFVPAYTKKAAPVRVRTGAAWTRG